MRQDIIYNSLIYLMYLIFTVSLSSMGFCSSIRFKDIALVPDNFIRFKDIVIINDHDQLSDDIKDLPLLDISDYPKKIHPSKRIFKKK